MSNRVFKAIYRLLFSAEYLNNQLMFDNYNFLKNAPYIKIFFSLPAVGRRGGNTEVNAGEALSVKLLLSGYFSAQILVNTAGILPSILCAFTLL